MSFELILATFGDESELGTDSTVLEQLADVVRGTLRESGLTDEDVEETTEQVQVDLPGGSAQIHSTFAIFPIQELDTLTLRIIFDVARAGDMMVLTEGGDYYAIVLDPSQRARLPEAKWQSKDASPLCRSPEELETLLESWYRVHSTYREQFVTDWTARSNRNRKSAHPSGGTLYLWDPWLNDHVPNGPECEWVDLYRFDPERNEIPKHPDVLHDLKDVCERHIQSIKESSSKLIDDEEWPPLDLRMRFYSADIWPDRVEFRFYKLDDSVATLMFEIARTGDMSCILPGGVILTDPGQETRLPQSWKKNKRIVSCQSATELKSLLRTLQVEVPPEDRGYGFNDVEPIPGTHPSRPRIVYIEAKPKETAFTHQDKVYKHKPLSPDGPHRPESGMMMARFWQMDTPAGQRFYAYDYSADGWLDCLRDFALSEDRAMGSIVNFETFVQDDGKRFPISECEFSKVVTTG